MYQTFPHIPYSISFCVQISSTRPTISTSFWDCFHLNHLIKFTNNMDSARSNSSAHDALNFVSFLKIYILSYNFITYLCFHNIINGNIVHPLINNPIVACKRLSVIYWSECTLYKDNFWWHFSIIKIFKNFSLFLTQWCCVCEFHNNLNTTFSIYFFVWYISRT